MTTRSSPASTTLVALLFLVAACAGDDQSSVAVSDTTTAAMELTETTLPDLDDLPVADLGERHGPFEEYVTPAMGGVRYSVSADHAPFVLHDAIIVFPGPPVDAHAAPRSGASIELVTQSIGASPISTADEFLAAVEAVDDAVIEPTGDAIELFGRRLRGYEISNGAELEEPKLFSTARFGAPVDSEFAPFPYAIVYLADTPAGVLLAMVAGSDRADAIAARSALSTLAATAEFTGPGLDEPLPPGEALAPADPKPPPEPALVLDDGAPPMEALFAAVDAGSYQLPNVGRTLTVEIGDDWFAQPNFPGLVVLTGPSSSGPNDRDIIFMPDVVEYRPSEAGPRPGGPAVPIQGVDDLLANPPSGFTITDVQERDGARGERWTRFDISSDDGAACALGSPCEAAFITSFGFVKILSHEFDHRVWWITHESGPDTVIFVSAFDEPEFVERASDLVETIEFG